MSQTLFWTNQSRIEPILLRGRQETNEFVPFFTDYKLPLIKSGLGKGRRQGATHWPG